MNPNTSLTDLSSASGCSATASTIGCVAAVSVKRAQGMNADLSTHKTTGHLRRRAALGRERDGISWGLCSAASPQAVAGNAVFQDDPDCDDEGDTHVSALAG